MFAGKALVEVFNSSGSEPFWNIQLILIITRQVNRNLNWVFCVSILLLNTHILEWDGSPKNDKFSLYLVVWSSTPIGLCTAPALLDDHWRSTPPAIRCSVPSLNTTLPHLGLDEGGEVVEVVHLDVAQVVHAVLCDLNLDRREDLSSRNSLSFSCFLQRLRQK